MLESVTVAAQTFRLTETLPQLWRPNDRTKVDLTYSKRTLVDYFDGVVLETMLPMCEQYPSHLSNISKTDISDFVGANMYVRMTHRMINPSSTSRTPTIQSAANFGATLNRKRESRCSKGPDFDFFFSSPSS